MIPSYSEKLPVPEQKHSSNSDDNQLQVMSQQINSLKQAVDYLQRELSRLKSEVQSLAQTLNRM